MRPEDLKKLIEEIEMQKTEKQTVEVKAAHGGCPTKLYGTLSSFSNQDDGGILVFGLEEAAGFARVGVFDPQELQQQVTDQCKEMRPMVRPLFTVITQGELTFVSAEIPGIDLADRPCFYAGKGRLKGSYIRVGDADEPMSEYEIYSYEAFRKKYRDEVVPVERATPDSLDHRWLEVYLARLKANKPNLSQLDQKQICELMSITREGEITLAAVLLFGLYPQAYFPQLCIIATVIPGTQVGQLGGDGERFNNNKRIEGNIAKMLEDAIQFVRANMGTKTIIDPDSGKRMDRTDYPVTAVRELLLNALVHRDYSIHTNGMPIQLQMFSDRLEITSPGGLYGRLRIDQLGKMQPDTRNPVIATALETLSITENRYSGIPTVRREMAEAGLPMPVFADERGSFSATLYKRAAVDPNQLLQGMGETIEKMAQLAEFCKTPRTRQEIAAFLNLNSVSYAIKTYLLPMVKMGTIEMTLPDRPGSSKQRYVTVKADNPGYHN